MAGRFIKDDDDTSSIQAANEETTEKQEDVDVKVETEQSSQDADEKEAQLDRNKPQQLSPKELDFWIKVATGSAISILLITWVIWPMSLYRNWIFSASYFKGYVTVSLIWLYATLIVIGFIPFYTGRHSVAIVFRGLYNDYIKKSK
ncbi:hypothetical protein Cantr_09624 [Candida viswanathii]|uniref:Uncharacterized protein n=1 Tax=Candida viswanathii TaxID=5486 RepID=A0A367YB69_9ASCO|nr:hypothetical protein Cantr_09624 [Candida viswanathii]